MITLYKLWKLPLTAGAVALIVTMLTYTETIFSQSTEGAAFDLSGSWELGSFGEAVVSIEQEGMEVRGYWKEYSGRYNCFVGSLWFKGTLNGTKITGKRYLCSGGSDRLNIEILNNGNILEVDVIKIGNTFKEMLTRSE